MTDWSNWNYQGDVQYVQDIPYIGLQVQTLRQNTWDIGWINRGSFPSGQSLYFGNIKMDMGSEILLQHPSAPTSDTSGKLRLQRTGSELDAYYWSSNQWNKLYGYNNFGSYDVNIALTGYTGDNPSATFHAQFDQFDIVKGTRLPQLPGNPSIPPVPAFALPMSQMPSPSSLITSVSTPQFIANNVASLPNDVASWLNQVEIDIGSVQYPVWLKQTAQIAGDVIDSATKAIGLSSAIVNKSLLRLGEFGLKIVLNNTNVSIALDSAKVADDLIGIAIESGNPVIALIDANTFIWGDLLAPQLQKFGKDPTDPNFGQFYQVPIAPLTFNLASTGNQALDSAMSSLLQSSYRAAQDLNGANHSFDRYTSAYNNSDAQSALLQLEAILYYLDLYKQEAAENASLIEMVRGPLGEVLPPTPTFDPAWLASAQQELLTNGFPSELSLLFADFGLSNSDIAEMQDSILRLTTNDFSGLSIDQGLGQIEQSMRLTASVPSNVPEPTTMLLLGLGLMGLAGVRRKFSN